VKNLSAIHFRPSVKLAVVIFWAGMCIAAAAKEKDKAKQSGTDMVDSGAFGVFTSGTRVATETFSIRQNAQGSVISSQFKSAQGEHNAEQSSELQLTPSVELRSYEWKEISPEKMMATVEPNDAFLIERYTNGTDGKTNDQNFLLPTSTLILDDYFFVQREVLAWKYLASSCKKDNGPLSCPLHQKVQFGALNPHARSSLAVAIEFAGREKLMLRGTERELNKFLMTSDTGDWALWLDDQFKLVRLVNDGGTEVVRD
jgi:hypothetical protein